MKKALYFFGFIVIITSSCRTWKNTQRTAVVKPKNEKQITVDSFATIKNQLSNLLYAPANFTTFYAKAKADFNSSQASGNATVYIRIKKDSVIWLSLTGPLNIEGARILITPDSVKIINKLEGSVQISSIAHLQKITKLPFTFSDFQNVIIGKPSLPATAVLNYEFKSDSILVAASDALINYMLFFNKNNFNLGQAQFKTINELTGINANIFLNDYHVLNDINFSADRDIAVTGSSPMKLHLNFKEYNFNQPQTFPFTISKNYSIKYD